MIIKMTFVNSVLIGKTLLGHLIKIKVTSTNLKSIRSTIDDILVCLSAANTSLDVIEKK